MTKSTASPVGEGTTQRSRKLQAYADDDTYQKINRLSRACGVSESKIITEMCRVMANNMSFVRWIQQQHNIQPSDTFYINPSGADGRLRY